jgi:hypothetical protein
MTHRWQAAAVALVVAPLAVAACAVTPATDGPSASSTTHGVATVAPAALGPAAQACQMMAQAVREGKTGDPATMTAVGNIAAKATDDDMRIEGNLLAWAADISAAGLAAGDPNVQGDLVETAQRITALCEANGL